MKKKIGFFANMVSVFLCVCALCAVSCGDDLTSIENEMRKALLTDAEREALSDAGTSLPGAAVARKLIAVRPHERMVAWQELGFYAFVHFGVNTFTDLEWGEGTESPTRFNPANVDTDQWVRTFKAAGYKGVIITAKHHDGFCLWDTRTTNHNVMNSAYPHDIVKMVSDSCKRYGLKFGIYLSPWDRNQGRYGIFGDRWGNGDGIHTMNQPKTPWTGPDGTVYSDYNDFFIAQLTELLDPNVGTDYGDVFAMWFDGAGSGSEHDDWKGTRWYYSTQTYNWPRIFSKIRELQPDCVLTNLGPDAAWIGNEAGNVLPSHWSVVPAAQAYAVNITSQSQQTAGAPPVNNKTDPRTGERENLKDQVDLIWNPLEADVSIRPGWFFHENQTPKSLADLLALYERCIGGNVNLILNVPPNMDGLINANDVTRLQELGARIKAIYGRDAGKDSNGEYIFGAGTPETNLLAADGVTVTTTPAADPDHPAKNILTNDDTFWQPKTEKENATITIKLPAAKDITHVMLQENIRKSQRIECFKIEVQKTGTSGWVNVYADTVPYTFSGATLTVKRNVGFKRICRLATKQTGVTQIRITISESRIYPTLKYVAAYNDPGV
ncbi:hypothetical protein AGMMS50267_08890 [Spirochaetia bacterium]|nr:hypothetical protein AGMMS50267_08890 [Spirochaetia bacterium]